MPADQAIAEEEECSTRALACVDVAGEVAVVVADEVCGAGRLDEVQTEVERASDIAEDALDSLLMLHRRPLHEPADEADGERQIGLSVHHIVQPADEAPVVCRDDLRRRAVSAKPQPLLHWSVGRVAASHSTKLQDPLGVMCLTEGDAIGILMHLDAEVEAEEVE